jgi:hypothetical protein
LEESKRREVRLRTKIKELGDNPAAGGDEANPAILQEGIGRLQRELEITKSENASLRSSLSLPLTFSHSVSISNAHLTPHRKAFGHPTAARSILNAPSGASAGEDDEEESKAAAAGGGGAGRVLGGASTPIVVPGTMEEMRQQLHSKWEAEKKLQKRIGILEKRLQEKVQEVDDAQAQLRRQKELTTQSQTTAQREKERAERLVKLSNPKHQQQQGGGESVLAMHGQEELQSRIFELEEENDAYKKKVIVQFPNEVCDIFLQSSFPGLSHGLLSYLSSVSPPHSPPCRPYH